MMMLPIGLSFFFFLSRHLKFTFASIIILFWTYKKPKLIKRMSNDFADCIYKEKFLLLQTIFLADAHIWVYASIILNSRVKRGTLMNGVSCSQGTLQKHKHLLCIQILPSYAYLSLSDLSMLKSRNCESNKFEHNLWNISDFVFSKAIFCHNFFRIQFHLQISFRLCNMISCHLGLSEFT